MTNVTTMQVSAAQIHSQIPVLDLRLRLGLLMAVAEEALEKIDRDLANCT
jgi:hypothetical protein